MVTRYVFFDKLCFMRPNIVISTASSTREAGLKRFDSIGGLNYAEAVASLGGLPSFLPNLDPTLAKAYIASADGLLLSGGADFDPHLYNQAPHPELGMVGESRDLFEIAAYHAAKEKGIPILGICRGIQAINVAEGGSLHQHIPALEHIHQHRQQTIDGSLFHKVTLEPSSALAQAFAASSIRTNSYHHQAIKDLAADFKIVAKTDDGIIEAIEHSSAPILGVQWHPEMSFARYPEQIAPFQVFMKAVQKQTQLALV